MRASDLGPSENQARGNKACRDLFVTFSLSSLLTYFASFEFSRQFPLFYSEYYLDLRVDFLDFGEEAVRFL